MFCAWANVQQMNRADSRLRRRFGRMAPGKPILPADDAGKMALQAAVVDGRIPGPPAPSATSWASCGLGDGNVASAAVRKVGVFSAVSGSLSLRIWRAQLDLAEMAL